MFLSEESLYITGLTNMASSLSDEIGKSFVEADCFSLKDYKKAISKYYEIPSNLVDLVDCELSLNTLFTEIFGNNERLVEGIIYWIRHYRGKEMSICKFTDNGKVCDMLSGCNGGVSSFYIVKDIYCVKFYDKIVCFVIGSNE